MVFFQPTFAADGAARRREPRLYIRTSNAVGTVCVFLRLLVSITSPSASCCCWRHEDPLVAETPHVSSTLLLSSSTAAAAAASKKRTSSIPYTSGSSKAHPHTPSDLQVSDVHAANDREAGSPSYPRLCQYRTASRDLSERAAAKSRTLTSDVALATAAVPILREPVVPSPFLQERRR